MKTMKFRFLIVFLLVFSSAAYIYAAEITKSLHKEFKVSENSVLVLKNKYGKVDVQNWENNQVVIDVKIRVEHPSKETRDRLRLLRALFGECLRFEGAVLILSWIGYNYMLFLQA